MKTLVFLIPILALASQLNAQQGECTFKKPIITIHFGTGNVRDVNNPEPSSYSRVESSCPTDGHYTYTSYTSRCFSDDWHTLKEDYTPGDSDGNMMLVNATMGEFLRTSIAGLKSGAEYELALSMMNVCKPTRKCPYPLLPNITARLQTSSGKAVALIGIGELARHESPRWTRYRALFRAPASGTPLELVMINTAPSGCGNDFVLDDITFRECVRNPPPPVAETKKTVTPKKQPTATEQKPKPATKPAAKKEKPKDVKQPQTSQIAKPETDSKKDPASLSKSKPLALPPAPLKLTTRANPLVKQIETESGEVRVELYDNGTIDGDTVSVYHNNKLLVANARLSQYPLTFRIVVDAEHPHHEFIMVAENLGSIPPNTSLMKVITGNKHYEVFISSTEQKNAKVVFSLKE